MAGKHAHCRTLRVFYNWLYSPRSGMGLNPWENPIKWLDPPKMAKRMLPSLTKEEVEEVIEKAGNVRDKATVSLFAESGLRLSELANVTLKDIDWSKVYAIIRVPRRDEVLQSAVVCQLGPLHVT